MTIKATKTSLYKLVAEKYTLPIMIHTQFEKFYRVRIYQLRWYMDGVDYTACFMVGMCGPFLRVETEVFNEETEERKVTGIKSYDLTVEELRERGMIAENRRRKDKA